MRRASIYLRGRLVGELSETSRNKFVFRYDDDYYYNPSRPDLSLTLTKKQQEYRASFLFPAFYNILSEGESRRAQAKLLGIDVDDDFGILLATAQTDVAGGITVKPL